MTRHVDPIDRRRVARTVRQISTTRTVGREDGYYPPSWLATERGMYARRARATTRQPGTVAWLAGCAGCLVGATVMWAATWNIPRPSAPCIPRAAVAYDASADEWVDRAGAPLLHAASEGQYPWCHE